MTTAPYPLSALRALTLRTQRLDSPLAFSAEAVVELVEALGYAQIDTLNVVNRSHDVTLWARFGAYPLPDFHRLIYTPGQRRLYEGWGHAASILSLAHYRYQRWRVHHSYRAWMEQAENRELAGQILERVRRDGALRVSELDYDGPQRGAWYDWKPPKMALEVLFGFGELMVTDRVNFQRVYDLRERVLPEWTDATPVAPEAARRFCLEQAARALGVFETRHLTWYAHMESAPVKETIKALVAEGALVKIQGQAAGGPRAWWLHRDNLPLLERAASGEIHPERTTFLAPFDSLFWAGERDQRLWGFRQVLECYKRPADRVYGYFCFPILHKDRLVGRFDPKLDRANGVLRLAALYLEPGVAPDEELIAAVAAAMRNFLAWHGARELVIEKSDPPEFAQKLLKAI